MTTTLSYTPAKVKLKLKQGDKWTETWPFTRRDDTDPEHPVTTIWDLTGWSAVGQIRDGDADEFTEVLAEIECEIIATDEGLNAARTTLVGVQTKPLPLDCFWEFVLVDPDNEEHTMMTGPVVVEREVARRA